MRIMRAAYAFHRNHRKLPVTIRECLRMFFRTKHPRNVEFIAIIENEFTIKQHHRTARVT